MSDKIGTVYLVGAGPGDIGLVTRRAIEVIRQADVLLLDALANRELVEQLPDHAETIYVGKVAGKHALSQDEINQLIVKHALAGKAVVRLKGGDPYLFGRGGEEALACRAAKIPFETVPGVTSAFAVAAAAGIPVTHREVARHVTVITASSGADGQGDPNYEWLAKSDGTIVLLMGLRRVMHIMEQLAAHGMDPNTPAAIISRGTTSEQRTLTGTIHTLPGLLEKSPLASPAIVVVGRVVELREHLAWFERRPLFGTTIGVTRARAQASSLSKKLRDLGAQVVEAPLIRTVKSDSSELDQLVAEIDTYQLLLFTSQNGVHAFFERLHEAGKDSRALGKITVGVVGSATFDACVSEGIHPDVMPDVGKRTGLGLVEKLASDTPLFANRVALVRAKLGDDRVVDQLEQLGAKVSLVTAYETLQEPASDELVDAMLSCDAITLASASTAKTLREMTPEGRSVPPVITIGPQTTSAAIWAELNVIAEAKDASVDSLVEAVVERAQANRTRLEWDQKAL